MDVECPNAGPASGRMTDPLGPAEEQVQRMQQMRRHVSRVATILLAVLPMAMFACGRSRPVEILIATSKPYDRVVERVRSVSGSVRHQYRNIDAIAATIPVTELAAFEAMPEVVAIEKDREIRLGRLRSDLEAAGPEYTYTIDAAELSAGHVSFTETAPEGSSARAISRQVTSRSPWWRATSTATEPSIWPWRTLQATMSR